MCGLSWCVGLMEVVKGEVGLDMMEVGVVVEEEME